MTLSKSNHNDQQSGLNSRLSKSESALSEDYAMNPITNNQQQSNSSEIAQISLLEERLQVNRRQRKVGEVIVRKQVETRTVKIPLKREKNINIFAIAFNNSKLKSNLQDLSIWYLVLGSYLRKLGR